MKKLVSILVIAGLFAPAISFAENTHSTDLESGSSQYWSISDGSQTGLDLGSDWSITAWIKLESAPSTNQIYGIVGKRSASAGNYSYAFYYHHESDGTKYLVAFSSSNGSNENFVSYDTGGLSIATWHQVAVTVTSGQTKFYIDGVGYDAAGDLTNLPSFNGSADFQVGNYIATGGVDNYMDGKIDDVRVWSRHLSDADVANLYSDSCTFNNGSSLQGWWLFNNNGIDQTANNNDLTNNNSATFTSDTPYTCPPLEPSLGGTGSSSIPSSGDLLVGDGAGIFGLLSTLSFKSQLFSSDITLTSGSFLISSNASTPFRIGSSTPLFSVDSKGHISASGYTPTLSSCGTSPSVIGDDTAGTIVVGASTDTCTLTFATSRSAAPHCVLSNQDALSNKAMTYTVSSSQIVINQQTLGGSDVDYICFGQ